MAEPINLKHLTEYERTILVKGIPYLRLDDKDFWENEEFLKLYTEWLKATNQKYAGFDRFRLACAQMRNKLPLTYKNNNTHNSRSIYYDTK